MAIATGPWRRASLLAAASNSTGLAAPALAHRHLWSTARSPGWEVAKTMTAYSCLMARRRRSRFGRSARWAGAVLCALLAGLWAASMRYEASGRVALPGGGGLVVGLTPGGVAALVLSENANAGWVKTYGRYGNFGPRDPNARTIWWPARGPSRMGRWYSVSVPIWMVLGTAVLLTCWLWRRGRRGWGPGRCAACGYDRAGLTPGSKCPECGLQVGAKEATA